MIQLTDIRVFLEIVAQGSFSEAARRLDIPKSTMTRQMDRLESTLGGALFRRTTREVILTAEGRKFLPRAKRLLDDGMDAENILRSQASGACGRLLMSAAVPFARQFIVPYLPAFKRRHPQVEVALWLTPGRMEVGPDDGQVEIAIRVHSSAGPGLARRK